MSSSKSHNGPIMAIGSSRNKCDIVSGMIISKKMFLDCGEFYCGILKTVSTNTPDRPVDNPSNISKPTTVSEHFLTNDHSANDITCTHSTRNDS